MKQDIIDKYLVTEDARNPKRGDKFEYKGKKLTVTRIGSGLGPDKYITVQFEKEKHAREIKMTDFFKGNEFKYISEASGAGTSYESMWNSWWSRGLFIYLRDDQVLFSHAFDFPTGHHMTEEDKQIARARGYILIDW